MGVREQISKYPVLTIAFTVVTVGALAWSYQKNGISGKNNFGSFYAFYSDDDGKTWFTDKIRNLPAFDHNGKPAYRAQVFHVGSGAPYVGWLEEYDNSAKSQLAGMKGDDLAFVTAMSSFAPRVKRPGDTKWVSPGDRRYDEITTPKAPDGSSATPERVGPQ